MQAPDELRYTSEHEWVLETGGPVRVGITDYAQDALGDIVFVTLPDVGTEVRAGQPMGEVESTKSVADVYAPVNGRVTGRNDTLESQPELVNSDPYGAGWMVEIETDGDLSGLLDADAYRDLVEQQG